MNSKVLKEEGPPIENEKTKFKNLIKMFDDLRVPYSTFKHPVYRIVVLGTKGCGKTSL